MFIIDKSENNVLNKQHLFWKKGKRKPVFVPFTGAAPGSCSALSYSRLRHQVKVTLHYAPRATLPVPVPHPGTLSPLLSMMIIPECKRESGDTSKQLAPVRQTPVYIHFNFFFHDVIFCTTSELSYSLTRLYHPIILKIQPFTVINTWFYSCGLKNLKENYVQS